MDFSTIISSCQVVSGFSDPWGCAVNSKGNIYIVDRDAHQVKVFDSKGNSLFKFGSKGSGDAQFNIPRYVAVDAEDRVIVSDSGNHRIQVFDASGKFLFKFGSSGNGDGQFICPYGITVNSKQEIIVCDYSNHRVQVFDSRGRFIWKFGINGTADGNFQYPYDVTVDTDDNIIFSPFILLPYQISLWLILSIQGYKYLTKQENFSSNLDQKDLEMECSQILKELYSCRGVNTFLCLIAPTIEFKCLTRKETL